MALVLTRSIGQAIRFSLPSGYVYLTLTELVYERAVCRVQQNGKTHSVGFELGRQRQVFPDVAIAFGKNERGQAARFAIEAPKSIGILRCELITADEVEADRLKAKWLDPA